MTTQNLTEEIDEDGIKKYQSIIGALQWAVSLCRFDIHVSVMTMGRFRAAPRAGHLERLKRICGYLRKYPDGAIRYRIIVPTEGYINPRRFDWMNTVYGKCKEDIPSNIPIPLGISVRCTTYEDANLMHDLTTGRSVTGIIHLVNLTPVEWFSKRQATVETATYGSEFVAARSAVEQIIDLRYTLRELGVPLDGPTWMFGDNESVVTSSTIPSSLLNKRHNALSYHRVREAVAAGFINFIHIAGTSNIADVLTKFLPRAAFWPLIGHILFAKGYGTEDKK